jgi:hypothetical protein
LGENLQNGKHAHHLVESFSGIQKTKLWGGVVMVLGDNLFSNGRICHKPMFKNNMILEVFSCQK